MAHTNSPPIYELGPEFYDVVSPAHFPKAILRYRNQEAAQLVELEHLTAEEWQSHFWAFNCFSNNIQKPLALRYHGHQFQNYNPQLGDGRGFLFAQFQNKEKLLDLGTKGSGQTPYSRGGDGRLTLKGAFREILATELLESYGVNTSKTFSVFETGESLIRHDEPSPTRSAVLVRLSHSHIRFGTFQRLAFLGQTENIKKLLTYCVKHYFSSLKPRNEQDNAAVFLQAVSHASAQLVSSWMMAGFVHGVLNTDNMNITGESFDYGPYRFLKTYDPSFTAAYFDSSGMYCYGRQPFSVLWNLHQLGFALKTAFPDLQVEELLQDFSDVFSFSVHNQLLKRLNLKNPLQNPTEASQLNQDLMSHFFQFLEKEEVLFEQTFFDLHSGAIGERLNKSPQKEIYKKQSFLPLKETLKFFEIANKEISLHPYFSKVQPCTLIIDELENLWEPIAIKDDWAPFETKLADIRSFRGVYT
ncbi:MAG: protein adenylyltransferase SelO family protein [Pseudobdellovibrionaceae bacterium]